MLTIPPPPAKKDRARPPRLSPLEVKALVRHRDGYRCRFCGMTARKHVKQTGKTLDVHRLIPGSRYTVKGCITVCRKCHRTLPKSLPGQGGTADGFKRVQISMSSAIASRLRHQVERRKMSLAAYIRAAVDVDLLRNEAEQAKFAAGGP